MDEIIEINGVKYRRVAEIERKAAAEERERAKWAAIGREVGEYKAGDVVEVVYVEGGITNGHPTGAVGYVEYDTVENPKVILYGYGLYCNVKLVVPVEQRFDKGGDER